MIRPATLLVTSAAKDLDPAAFPGVKVVDADTFLAGGPEVSAPGTRVINLCRSWRYLSRGYYVSLLAEARGQQPTPSVHAIEGFLDPHTRFRHLQEAGVDVIDPDEARARLRAGRAVGASLEDSEVPPVRVWEQADLVFRPASSSEVLDLLVILGRTEQAGLSRLAARVYRAWPFPILDVRAVREGGRWRVFAVNPRRIARVDAAGQARLSEAVRRPPTAVGAEPRPRQRSIAVLYDPKDPFRASTPETLDRVERVFRRRGLRVERIGTEDLDRLGEHDGLWIRTLTGLDKPAWRFALRAEALGMPVIDQPADIVRCSNKVFLHELLTRAGLPTPTTRVFGAAAQFSELAGALGLPFVIKLPDGSFSAAVFRIQNEADWNLRVGALRARSPLLLAQAFVRSDFDWRVTVLDGRPLFVCKYHMVPGHWQIRSMGNAQVRYGRVEAVPRDKAPTEVVRVACRAAGLIGAGMYGVDVKVSGQGPMVIEVNDNPNLDTGYEDAEDGDRLYEDIVSWFERRLPAERPAREAPRKPAPPPPPDDHLAPLRTPVGRVTERHTPYDLWEVMGLELEYPIVDRDLNAVSQVEDLLADLAGRPTSDVELGLLGFSNEIMDHVLEIKNRQPLASPARMEEVLAEGVRRATLALAARQGSRLLPGGMHPWLDPTRTRLWSRSNRTIYQTYARLFDVKTHGWGNVQAVHVNLPVGRDEEAVALMRAARLLVPYLPAVAASSPIFEGELQPMVDGRLHWILEHQLRLPESCGELVPEPLESLRAYKKDVLGRMYDALDRLPDAGALRHEFLNARAAVFKFSRQALEIRVLDVQECPKMDVALAVLVKRCLRRLVTGADKLGPASQEALVADLRATVHQGMQARVHAPWAPVGPRDAEGRVEVRELWAWLWRMARQRAGEEEAAYLELLRPVLQHGSLAERIAARLEPQRAAPFEEFTDAARRVYVQLADCLVENRPWSGRT